MGAHQGVSSKGPAVHHADVQGRVQQLILREVLRDDSNMLQPMPQRKGQRRLAKACCAGHTPALLGFAGSHTHHFKPLDQGVKIGVLLIIVDQG